jgi:excisionase family DNA binding protein
MLDFSKQSRLTSAPAKLLLTIDVAAQCLSLGRTLMYELVMRKQILSVKVGRTRRIPHVAIQQFVERQIAGEEGAVRG